MPLLHPPSATPVKVVPAKPPLHNSTSCAAAGGPVLHSPHLATASKLAKADTTLDFSDNESISFAVENSSMAGKPARYVTSSMLPPPVTRQCLISASPLPLPRRLSRAGSIGSIQFNSEPGSRGTSPTPMARQNLCAVTPVEKAEAQTSPLSGGRGCMARDSSIEFFEQSAESPEFGLSLPAPSQAAMLTAPVKRGSYQFPAFSPLSSGAAAVGAAGRHSASTEDSIAFHMEDDSDVRQSNHTPASPHMRSLAAVINGSFAAMREGRSASAVESCAGDLMDSESIAFMIEDETDEKSQQRRLTIPYSRRRGSAAARASPSRPRSPSIQIDIDSPANERVFDKSDSLLGERGGQLLPENKLPVFGQSRAATSSPILDAPVCSPCAPLNSMASTGRFDAAAEADTAAAASSKISHSTKKTVVMNRLQQQRKQHSRLPQPHKNSRTRVFANVEPSHSGSVTLQPAAVAAPLAAQVAGGLTASPAGASKKRRAASLGDRNFSRKKDARALAPFHSASQEQRQQQNRRSKESLASQTVSASPNTRHVTEEGSDGSANSPPEPLCTGHRSQASTDLISSSASPVQGNQRGFPAFPERGAPRSSVQRHLGNEGMKNGCQQPHRPLSRDSPLFTGNDETSRSLYDELSAHHQHVTAGEKLGGQATGSLGEAEQWRQFNQRQRAELAELRKRIAVARRQDRTLLESSPSHQMEALALAPSSRSIVPKPTPMGGGYSNMGPRSHVALCQPLVDCKDAKSGGERCRPLTDTGGASPHTGSARRLQAYVKSTYAPTGAAKQPSLLARRPGLSVSPTRHDPRSTSSTRRASHSILAQSAAAASVADVLGILWPPHLLATKPSQQRSQVIDAPSFETGTPAVDLYFVNGSRLTPEQVERFFDLVHVQRDAESRTAPAAQPRANAVRRAGTLSSASPRQKAAPPSLTAFAKHDGALAHIDPAGLDACGRGILRPSSVARDGRAVQLSERLAALLPKKAVRRSQVLREVFDAMDLKRQGSIVLDFLPFLARLFEAELATIEHTRQSLLQGKAIPLHSLLESAVASRQQHATSWRGARGAVAPGGRKGVDAAHSGALDYAGLARDAQANLAYLTHRLLLLSFTVNVVIPIAAASHIPLLDFSTLCMIVYAAVDNTDGATDSPKEEWQRVVQQYFTALAV
ncbi:hypothetical protein LSCM4_03150 [Leishmania orientalis]|uniref:EF-hand domain-containing protein n=1 Tax=Leishmania orientalis TaxID=2249476 RepID=A0A836GB20_9TRYP|nr:hypothetical protein LSCM4_03150 [Leishmania orientalis]